VFSKQMKRHMSSRSCGSWVVAGTLLALIMVAALHLAKVGAVLSKLTQQQADYIGVPLHGPFKHESYRY